MKPAAYRKLEAVWRKRLSDSGFQDLEGQNRDGPLSNRGLLHPESEDHVDVMVQRVEHGAAYTEWAQDVLHRMPRHDVRSRLRRRIWERHCQGEGLEDIGQALGIGYHAAREAVNATKERYKQCREVKLEKARDVRKLVRSVDPKVLSKVAAALLVAMGRPR